MLVCVQLSFLSTTLKGKEAGAQEEWDSIAELIHMAGEPGATLNLKVKVYHVDLVRQDVERQKLKLIDIGSMVVPWQWYLRHIDPDGTWPPEEVRAEMLERAKAYFHQVLAPTTPKP
jgi:hypothetical protein